MKTVAIIQARMGSTRLPGKVMMKIKGKTILDHVITRVRQAKEIDDIVIATTTSPNDEVIVRESQRLGVNCFRGAENDVLSRYYLAAKENQADVVVRITSDCPLIDPKVLDEVIRTYHFNDYEIVTNAGNSSKNRTYPRGLDVEIFSIKALENANKKATKQYQREHVTPYIYESSSRTYYYKNDENYSDYRWTLDTVEDLDLIRKVYNDLYEGNHDFYLEEIVDLIKRKPLLKRINAHVEQKKLN